MATPEPKIATPPRRLRPGRLRNWFLGEIWPWGWVMGVVMLLMASPSAAEKKGYRDF